MLSSPPWRLSHDYSFLFITIQFSTSIIYTWSIFTRLFNFKKNLKVEEILFHVLLHLFSLFGYALIMKISAYRIILNYITKAIDVTNWQKFAATELTFLMHLRRIYTLWLLGDVTAAHYTHPHRKFLFDPK